MEVQIEKVVQEKILASIEAPLPRFTRRDICLPDIPGKAFVVIGMRRAGKTTFLHQCRADLIETGRDPRRLLYFNFEDERLGGLEASSLGIVPDTHLRLFPKPADQPVTLFLDEIQLIPGWEKFARRMLDTPGYELFLSGSSAKLLSREIATSMRGRAWEVSVYPFSFAEFLTHHGHDVPEDPSFLSAKKSTTLDHHFADYLQVGGFPEAQSLGLAGRRQLLQNYVDVLLLRDVIERHEIANPTALRWMVRRLLSAPAGLFSISKFAAELKSQAIPVGRETLYEFLDHLEDAFLLHPVPIDTDSEKRRQVNARKVYPADPALIPVFDRSGKANLGHALETAVFIELKRRGAEVAYVKTKSGFEIDFHAHYLDGTEEFIQVCASVEDAMTLAREVRSLEDQSGDAPRLILTAESRTPFPKVPKAISIKPAWQWILERDEY